MMNRRMEVKLSGRAGDMGVGYFDHFGDVNKMMNKVRHLFAAGGTHSWHEDVFLNEFTQLKSRSKSMKKGRCNVASFATSYNTPPRLASMAAHLGGLFVLVLLHCRTSVLYF
jgi:hypothetical protein